MTADQVCSRLHEAGWELTLGDACDGGFNGAYFARDSDGTPLVLKWHERPEEFERDERAYRRVERLRALGSSLIGRRLPPIRFDGGVAFLQEELAGSWRDDVDADLVGAIATLNELQAGLGDREDSWQEIFERTLLEGGTSWCRHDVVASYSPATRHLVEQAKALGRRLPPLPDGDVVHFDLHHRNVLRTLTGLSGVIDWEGARSGDRRFDWASTGLTDIHHQGRDPGEDAHHGDHGTEEDPSTALVHTGVQG